MKILDKAPSKTLATIAGLLTMFAFLFLSPYLPYMTIYAQQTGPGGVPAAGGSSSFTCNAANNCAALNNANTFTQNQTINSYAPYFMFAGNSGSSYIGMNADGDGIQLSSNSAIQLLAYSYSATNYEGVPSNSLFGFYASTSPSPAAGPDTTFSRVSPDVMALGNGNLGDSSGWLQVFSIGNGASGNTDLRGHVTLASGSGSYTFSKTYTVAPTCVATDTTSQAPVKVSSTTTTLTLTGAGTDTLNYVCAD